VVPDVDGAGAWPALVQPQAAPRLPRGRPVQQRWCGQTVLARTEESTPGHGTPPRRHRRAGRSHVQIVRGTGDTLPPLLYDVGVDHRGGHIRVPEQVLNGPNIRPALQQMGGEGMPERISTLLIMRR
jgi:hypothetical protein